MDDLVTYEDYASNNVGVLASDLQRTGAKCWPKQISDHAAQKLGRPSSKCLFLHPIGVSFSAVLSTTSTGLKMARARANYAQSSQRQVARLVTLLPIRAKGGVRSTLNF